MHRKLLIVSVISLLSILGCDSEEPLMDEALLYGRWKWVITFQYGLGGPDTLTPQQLGYDLSMKIGSSDTIEHFRNDTLYALSVLTSKKRYSDRIIISHGFLDSLQVSDGYEVILFPKETLTYRSGDTIRAVITDVADFSAVTVYVK